MAANGSIIQGAHPVFDDLKIKILVVFVFQDVADVVLGGIEDLGCKVTEEVKKHYMNLQKLDNKAIFKYFSYTDVLDQRYSIKSTELQQQKCWEIL